MPIAMAGLIGDRLQVAQDNLIVHSPWSKNAVVQQDMANFGGQPPCLPSYKPLQTVLSGQPLRDNDMIKQIQLSSQLCANRGNLDLYNRVQNIGVKAREYLDEFLQTSHVPFS
jgi:hypothetical protein